MKSSEEMYESLLNRRDEYIEKRSRNRRRITVFAACAALVLLIGAGVWHISSRTAKQNNAEKTANTGNSEQKSEVQTNAQQLNEALTADSLGAVIINGIEYHEIGWGNPDGYTKKEFLGKASDFEGNYKTHIMAYDGDLYSVNEFDNFLLLFITDSDGIVVFKAVGADTVLTDSIGTITIDGRTYRQATSFNADDYTRTECIGRASEFDGTYSGTPDVDGDVYMVQETDDIIIILLDNGGKVVLKFAEQG